MSIPLEVTLVSTAPIEGQKPGTSGLRKKTKLFMEGHYLANFVQATFSALLTEGAPVQGATLPPLCTHPLTSASLVITWVIVRWKRPQSARVAGTLAAPADLPRPAAPVLRLRGHAVTLTGCAH